MYLPVENSETLTEVFAKSDNAPQILFAFDPYCPVNTRAFQELDQISGWDIHVVNVARNHALGIAIQLATRVKHESPQVLVLRGRVPIWHASHRGITAEAVRDVLADL